MNNIKKLLKAPEPTKKVAKPISPMLWIIPAVILSIALIVGIVVDQHYEEVLVTVEEEDYRLSDLSYYIYNVESYYNSLDLYYRNFGMSYWDMAADETGETTTRDIAMEEAMKNIVFNEVMYREALANNYSINEEEKEEVTSNISSVLYEQGLSKYRIRENGFTAKYLEDVLSRMTLAERRKQDVIDSLDIDNASIEAGYSKDEYKQYDFDYIYISTETTDEENNKVAMDETAKKAAYDKIAAIVEKANSTDDWTTLLDASETELIYSNSFILEDASKETTGSEFDDDFRTFVKTLDNGKVSEIFEGKDGYYIVRMLNNNSQETYTEVVENAIKTAEEEAFQKEYTDNILTKYKYEINNKAVNKLKMGTITLN